jgi:hypothetical protein
MIVINTSIFYSPMNSRFASIKISVSWYGNGTLLRGN